MSINKNGIITEQCFSTSLLSQYDTNFYIEPDNSIWIRIAHHNNPANTGLFSSSDTFTTSVYKDKNRWFNVSLCNLISGTWELMVKQKQTSTSSEEKYRWTQKTNPMGGSWSDVQPTSSNIIRNTSSGYINNSMGGIYKHNSNTYLVIANVYNGNWFGAFGAWTNYNGGIPGFPSTAITTGYMDLYLRVDSVSNIKVSKNKVGFIAKDFIEL